MWGVIDWKGMSDVNDNKILHDSQIQKYFRNIFQSHKTKQHPTVSNITNKLHNYFLYIPILDDVPNMSEVELALNNIHRGTEIDDLPPIVLKILKYLISLKNNQILPIVVKVCNFSSDSITANLSSGLSFSFLTEPRNTFSASCSLGSKRLQESMINSNLAVVMPRSTSTSIGCLAHQNAPRFCI